MNPSVIQFSGAYYWAKQLLLSPDFILFLYLANANVYLLIKYLGLQRQSKKKKSSGVYLSGLENAFAYQLTEFIIA